jgi:hypothetical protein
MKKFLVLGLSISMILLEGCGVETNDVNKTQAEQVQKRPKDMDPMDLPQVTAFQDEKTREFMVSTKEEEPGYYLLEGKSKRFRMLFPENRQYMVRRSSYVSENEETIGYDSYDEDSNITFDMQVSYFKGHSFIGKTDVMLEMISGDNGYDGEFQEQQIQDKEIYIAFMKTVYEELEIKNNYDYNYFGLIRPINNKNEGMDFSITVSCKDDTKGCSLKENNAREKVDKIIQSIQFLDKENK